MTGWNWTLVWLLVIGEGEWFEDEAKSYLSLLLKTKNDILQSGVKTRSYG